MNHSICFSAVFLSAALMAAKSVSGAIYADFTVPQGTFTVELDALNAPRAVANFLGLTGGTQTWRDPVTGAVRGGAAGGAFYDGMPFYSTFGGFTLLGGLRPYPGSDGNEYWEGPGFTILDEATNGVALVRGVLALAEFAGPHSGGGELAILLTNAPYLGSGWTGFGAVTGAGMAVVEAVVNSVTGGSGRVLAQIAIRDGGMTPEENAALNAARDELPLVEAMPLGLGKATNVLFESAPQSQACLSTASNLLSQGWSVYPGTWNTGTNETRMDLPLTSIPGIAERLGFLYGSQAVYPKMTVAPFSGKQRLGMAHTGTDMQYWLDFTGATGIWARVSNSVPVESGTIDWIGQELETANSVHMVFFIGFTAYHYWLGFAEAGATTGRFYCELWYFNAELTGTDSGLFELGEGWGGMKSARKAWNPMAATSFDPAPGKATMRTMAEWRAIRASQRELGLKIGGTD